jgi:hypothetical protein
VVSSLPPRLLAAFAGGVAVALASELLLRRVAALRESLAQAQRDSLTGALDRDPGPAAVARAERHDAGRPGQRTYR